jgi:replication-associated recombination protein RarA
VADKKVWRFGEQVTVGGYQADEVVSWLQKACRRGLERDALFAATELDLSGYGGHAWRRIKTIVSEDVGVADRHLPAVIHALHSTWLDERKRSKPPGSGMLQLAHAVMLVARASKSRAVDHACMVMYRGDRAAMQMVVPTYALDSHTARGRRMGRRGAAVREESYRLENEAVDVPNPFADEARAVALGESPSAAQLELGDDAAQ